MTTEVFSPQGQPLALADLQRLAQMEFMEASGSFPDQTEDFRTLGGYISAGGDMQLGPWYMISGIYGPRTLIEKNGPVMALEFTDRNGVTGVTYCGSQQIIPGLSKPRVRDYIEAGGHIFMRWDYHDSANGKNPFYTCSVQFGGEWPIDPVGVSK